MCGIAGVVNFQQKSVGKDIRPMLSKLRHRGPDDEGYLLGNTTNGEYVNCSGPATVPGIRLPALEKYVGEAHNLAFGHRRLSIIDLSNAGHGPMGYSQGELWISYNGEVYNYLELRAELEEIGYRFETSTDTEVVLAAYSEWGENCLSKLNGMWAFAIWDRTRKQLFCARDRFGIKPFYYYWDGKLFLFASEIKAILAHPAVSSSPNQAIVYDYLALGSLDHTTSTFFEGIKRLPPAHALLVHLKHTSVEVRSWWDISKNLALDENNSLDEVEVVAKFQDLLTDSVRLRLRSDVPIGSCLSGGLDSSSIVALVNKLLLQEEVVPIALIGEKQKVFSACFDDRELDERPFIRKIVDSTGADAYQIFPSSEAGLWKDLEELVWHQEEPFNSTSIYSQWSVMRLTREMGVTVLLDGQGGDELLAGYLYHFGPYLSQVLKERGLMSALRGVFQSAFTTEQNNVFLFGLMLFHSLPQSLQQAVIRGTDGRYRSNPTLSSTWMDPAFSRRFDHRRHKFSKHLGDSTLAERLYRDVFTTSLPALLRYEDRNSMAFSLEARVPFLDYRLVEFVFSLPASFRIRSGWSKWILRQAMGGTLPEGVRWRRGKLGFTTPEKRWLQEGISKIKIFFNGPDFMSATYLNHKTITRLQNLGTKGIKIPGLWRLINLEIWLRTFFS